MENQSTQIIQNDQGTPPDQEKRLKLMERILSLDLIFNVTLGIILISLISLLVWRFDIIKSLSKPPVDNNNQKTIAKPPLISQLKPVPEPQDLTPQVYINEQGIDIEKAFATPPTKISLSIYGHLKKEVLGFLPYWMVSKSDEINTDLLTSVSYFGLEVDGAGNIVKNDITGKPIDPWVIFNSDKKFADFVKLAKKKRIKVYITLKCFDQVNIIRLATTPEARTNFINNAIYLIDSKSLDGLNIDFEYIGTPTPAVIDGFSLLISDLNRQLKRNHPNTFLSIDTFVDAASQTRIHDVEVLAKNSDALVIMGYDFHTPNSSSAGPVAPFEGYGYSLNGLLNSYLDKVAPEKIILAVPYYGYDWPTSSAEANAKVAGNKSNVKVYPYAEIANNTQATQIKWDENARTPWYSYIDTQTKQIRVVHYENLRSLGIKYDYINQKKLQGVGIWALGYDGKRSELLQLLADKFTE